MQRQFLADIPSSTDNLVACKVCGLIKTLSQFHERGCENCPFLEMRGDRHAVEDATTGAFSGMAAVMDPRTGWTSKWMHLSNFAAGVYCLSVDEELPYEIKEALENKDINYRIRNDDFYPPDTANM